MAKRDRVVTDSHGRYKVNESCIKRYDTLLSPFISVCRTCDRPTRRRPSEASVKPPGSRFTSAMPVVRLRDNSGKHIGHIQSTCAARNMNTGKNEWRRWRKRARWIPRETRWSFGFRPDRKRRTANPRNLACPRARLIVFRTICARLRAHVARVQPCPR